MAARGAFTTSAEQEAQDLRRRYIPNDGSNGNFAKPSDESDDKKIRKVFSLQRSIGEGNYD